MGQIALEQVTRQTEDDGTREITDDNRYVDFNIMYQYCDQCGSFRLKKSIPFAYRLAIAALLVVMVVAGIPAFTANFRKVGQVACIALPAGLVILYILVKANTLRCQKCGNRKFSYSNPKHYPLYDLSVLDVSKEEAVTFETEKIKE